MVEKIYDKIEQRVTRAIPDWKDWSRRLRRIYASLEDWGSGEEAVEDMIEQWGWDLAVVNALIKKPHHLKWLLVIIERPETTPRKRVGQKYPNLRAENRVYARGRVDFLCITGRKS